MSIFAGFGAAPSNFTVPRTVATVFGSIGVAAGCAAGAAAVGCASGVSFLLQPASSQKAMQRSPSVAVHTFLFMISPFLESLNW